MLSALEWCEFCWSVRRLFAAPGVTYKSVTLDVASFDAFNAERLIALIKAAGQTPEYPAFKNAYSHLTAWLLKRSKTRCTGMAVHLMHFVTRIESICGSGTSSGGPFLIMLIAAVDGRIFFGKLSDIIGPMPTRMAATAWQTVIALGCVYLDDILSFRLFAPLYGFGYGGVMTGVWVTVRVLAHPSHRAVSRGVVLAFGWLGHALGGWRTGLFFDLTETYFWAFANAALAGPSNNPKRAVARPVMQTLVITA